MSLQRRSRINAYADPAGDWIGLTQCRNALHRLRDDLMRFRQGAEDCGLWPGEEPSLGNNWDDRFDILHHLILVAQMCDSCYTPGVPGRARALSRLVPVVAADPREWCVTDWHEAAGTAVRMLSAAAGALAGWWGIEGVDPGGTGVQPMRSGQRLWIVQPDDPMGWLTTLPVAVARTIERSARRLDAVLSVIGGGGGGSRRGKPGAADILTPLQQEAFAVLKGKGMLGRELAKALNIDDESVLCRTVTTPLKERGMIDNNRRLGGYYRPDAPPGPAPRQRAGRGREIDEIDNRQSMTR